MKTEIKAKAPVARVPDTPAVQTVVYHSDVTPADGTYIRAANDVKTNLAALDSAIHTSGAVTVEKLTTAESGYAATYIVKQGGSQVGASINIPKDYLVKNAELKEVETADTPYTGAAVGDKYIDFTVNTTDASGTAQHIYLPVKDLVDVYTSGSAAGDMVVVSVNSNNQITATITDGTVTKAKLASGVQDSLDNADNAVQGVKLDGASSNLSKDSNNVVTIPNAVATGTGETNGLMTAADKAKLDGIATGAQVNVLEKVKIGETALTVNTSDKSVSLAVNGTYDSSTNRVATESTVTNAIGGLDVSEYAQGSVLAAGGTTTIKIKGIKEVDGKIEVGSSTVDTELAVDGEYNAASNKIATVGSINTAIGNKADKAVPTTAGNFAALDANGNLTDSGKTAGDFKTKQTAVGDGDAGTGTASTTVVTSVTQNTNGVISVAKATIPNRVASTSGSGGSDGLMLATDAEKLAGIAEGAQVNVLEGVQVGGTDLSLVTDTKKVNIATDGTYNSATNAIATKSTVTTAISGLTLQSDITNTKGKTVATITESNGIVGATFQDIEIGESQVTGLQTDLASKADKVANATNGHFAGLDANGNLTDSGKSITDFQPAGDYKTIQTAVSDPTVPVSGTSTAVEFIDTISQDTNGVITPTKKKIAVDGSTIEISSGNDRALQVKDGGIVTAKIADSNVTTAKIADSNVTTAKIADGAVTEGKLAVLNSFQLVDQSVNSESAYYHQKYTVTIVEGVLTVTPAGRIS